MKKILLFISGMATAALFIALAFFFLWNRAEAPKEAPQNVPKLVSGLTSPPEIVTLTGTVVMPPEIRIHKPREGIYRAHLLYGPKLDKMIILDFTGPTAVFPHQFRRVITRKNWESLVKESQGTVEAAILYVPKIKVFQENMFPYYLFFEPTAMGYLKVPAEALQQNTNEIHLGEIRFDRVSTQPFQEKCHSDSVLLAGKISPPRPLLQKLAGSKSALVIYPLTPQIKDLKAESAVAEFDKSVLHYQYIDFSRGAASFSVPRKPSPSSLLTVAVVRCEPSEDLKTCARTAFPPVNTLHNPERVFLVRNQHYEYAICGQSGFQGMIPEY